MTMRSALRMKFYRCESLDFLQLLEEILHILHAASILVRQLGKLASQQSALPFCHSIVPSEAMMLVPQPIFAAAIVPQTARNVGQFIGVRENKPPFARGQALRRLEAKGCGLSKCAGKSSIA